VVLLGIPTRGVTLAARLARNITEFSSVAVPAGHSTSRFTGTT